MMIVSVVVIIAIAFLSNLPLGSRPTISVIASIGGTLVQREMQKWHQEV